MSPDVGAPAQTILLDENQSQIKIIPLRMSAASKWMGDPVPIFREGKEKHSCSQFYELLFPVKGGILMEKFVRNLRGEGVSETPIISYQGQNVK